MHGWRFGLRRCVWAAPWCVHPSSRVHMVWVDCISFVSMMAHELDGLRAGALVEWDGMEGTKIPRPDGRWGIYKYAIPCTDESTKSH